MSDASDAKYKLILKRVKKRIYKKKIIYRYIRITLKPSPLLGSGNRHEEGRMW